MPGTNRAPYYVIEALETAVRRLQALVDNDNTNCTVNDTCGRKHHIIDGMTGRDAGTVKDIVRPYVTSWITPDVERALAWARGERRR